LEPWKKLDDDEPFGPFPCKILGEKSMANEEKVWRIKQKPDYIVISTDEGIIAYGVAILDVEYIAAR
jgi:hypothetical protein